MNTTELHTILQNHDGLTSEKATLLENLLQEFPYFQSVRAIHLQFLYSQKNYKYNQELRITAAHTCERDILFDYITSDEFVAYRPLTLDSKTVSEKTVAVKSEPSPLQQAISKFIASAPSEKQEDDAEIRATEQADTMLAEDSSNKEVLEARLEIGSPLHFEEKEKHSFQEWLQLYKVNPIIRENEDKIEPEKEIISEDKQKKLDLIDKFIETNPKIVPTKNAPIPTVNVELSSQDNSTFMTETLAKIYLEQKKYQKAIQAYEILILKYPEKSSFFADQILDIKALQQYNS